jgi:polar amino acid transport system substrate-binding protein
MKQTITAGVRLAALACAVAALLMPADGSARTLAEVQSLGAISMCAHPDALPYASDKPEAPGIQVEIGQSIARGLGLALNTEWVVPRRRVAQVNCDMLFDSVNDPKVYDRPLLLSRPYQKSGLALGLGRDAGMIGHYRELKKGQKIGVMVNSVASVVLGKAGVTTSPYAFQADMIEDLEKGQLYGAAVSSAAMSYYIFRNPGSGLRLANAFDGEPDLNWDVAVGLRKSDQALLDAVNRVLDSLLADGTISRIYARYGIEHRMP